MTADWVSARDFLATLSEDDRKTLYREACRATYTPELIEDAWSVKVFVPLDAIAFFVEEPVQRVFRLLSSTYIRISKAVLESQGLTEESQKLDE